MTSRPGSAATCALNSGESCSDARSGRLPYATFQRTSCSGEVSQLRNSKVECAPEVGAGDRLVVAVDPGQLDDAVVGARDLEVVQDPRAGGLHGDAVGREQLADLGVGLVEVDALVVLRHRAQELERVDARLLGEGRGLLVVREDRAAALPQVGPELPG